MKKNKALALHLIQEDLKYNQLAFGLQALGIDIGFYPDLAPVIAQLMGIPKGQLTEEWVDAYVQFMIKVRVVAWEDKRGVKRLARACYWGLLAEGQN